MQHGGTIEEQIVHGERYTDDSQAGEDACAFLGELYQSIDSAALQDRLMEQIGAGVAADRQFGENEDVDALALGSPHQGEKVLHIESTIGDAQQRHGGGDAQETEWSHETLWPHRIAELLPAMLFYRLIVRRSGKGETR